MFGEETTTRLQGLVVAKVLLYILVDIATNSTQPVSCYSRVFFSFEAREPHSQSIPNSKVRKIGDNDWAARPKRNRKQAL